jgi:hypothetical protein
MAQVEEFLSRKCEALSSNPALPKKMLCGYFEN